MLVLFRAMLARCGAISRDNIPPASAPFFVLFRTRLGAAMATETYPLLSSLLETEDAQYHQPKSEMAR